MKKSKYLYYVNSFIDNPRNVNNEGYVRNDNFDNFSIIDFRISSDSSFV